MIGALTYKDYLLLFKNKLINSNFYNISQIQPSSIDLSLSSECYEIKYSFLSPNSTVRSKLKKLTVKKIDLKKNYVF